MIALSVTLGLLAASQRNCYTSDLSKFEFVLSAEDGRTFRYIDSAAMNEWVDISDILDGDNTDDEKLDNAVTLVLHSNSKSLHFHLYYLKQEVYLLFWNQSVCVVIITMVRSQMACH